MKGKGAGGVRPFLLLLLASALSFSSIHAQQQGVQYFGIRSAGCEGIQPLDFRTLLDATGGNGGKVAVRAVIDATGAVVEAHYLAEVERSGPESFWHAVENVVRTWCFSQGAVTGTTHIDYLVVIHSPREGGGGYIEINARDLVLADGWLLPVDRPADLVRIRNLDEGNVILTEVPPQFVAAGPTGFWAGVVKIWHQLGYAFQVIFVALFIGLVVAVIGVGAAGAKSWVRPSLWDRLRRRSVAVEHDDKRWPEDLGSWDAQQIRTLWIEAIKRSQLDPEVLPGIDGDTMEKLRELDTFASSQASSTEEIVAKARELGLVGRDGVLSEADFVAEHKGLAEEVTLPAMSIEEAKEKAYELIEAEKGRSGLAKLGQKIDKCKTPEDVEKVLNGQGLTLRRVAPQQSLKGELVTLADARRKLGERLEWAKLYSRFRERGWPGLDAAELDRLRRLTWEHWCRSLVERALQRARTLANNGIDLFEVFAAGLSNHLVNRNEWWSSQEIDRSVDRALGEKLDSRRSTLDALWAIGAVAPLFGLFGTVWGISQAFGKIQNIQEAQLRMAKLAGDINVALSTTIVGLIIGILAFVAYYVYKDRIERDGARVSRYFTNITNLA